jgi:two-component system cell cycle response regulator CpdR
MDPILVLLVEDEPLLSLDVEFALVEAGYAVVVATSGNDALAALASTEQPYAAIVTDIRIGRGPDGWAVAKRAREILPGVPVIYMSGDSAADWTSMGVPASVMLSKPMALSQIIVALAQLINARTPE